jgi:hypothetical protein
MGECVLCWLRIGAVLPKARTLATAEVAAKIFEHAVAAHERRV